MSSSFNEGINLQEAMDRDVNEAPLLAEEMELEGEVNKLSAEKLKHGYALAPSIENSKTRTNSGDESSEKLSLQRSSSWGIGSLSLWVMVGWVRSFEYDRRVKSCWVLRCVFA
jgi:hypothetical protein